MNDRNDRKKPQESKSSRRTRTSDSPRFRPEPRRRWPLGTLFIGIGLLLVLAAAVAFFQRRSGSSSASHSSAGGPSASSSGAAVHAVGGAGTGPAPASYVARPSGTVTFSREIAPIIYRQCAPCHRPGQAAPFSLLSYREVQKRATQIVEVTRNNYMPPWLPEHGYGEFSNERRLNAEEKGLLEQWTREGAPEGDPTHLPPAPLWQEGWLLGQPDLVVTMPQAYTLEADGTDLYRNFSIPVPLDRDRYVRAVEFAPGNPKIVHHAFFMVDSTGATREMEGSGGTPGFPGMNVPAETPNGQFLSWQPGLIPIAPPLDTAWKLTRGSSLVFQLHLNRTGKPEPLQSSMALYFTDQVPSNTFTKLLLGTTALDIPAGATNYCVTNTFVLPVESDIVAVKPHAHYLARSMYGYAILPDGSRQWLLKINQWDFKWQGEYRYTRPVRLPAGTTLRMEFSYDNSTNNISNPHQPPRRVLRGLQSNDEMAELWFQIRTRSAGDLERFAAASGLHSRDMNREGIEFRVAIDPRDAEAQVQLSRFLWGENKKQEAWSHLNQALAAAPTLADAHFTQGVFYRMNNQLPQAQASLEIALRLNPKNAMAHGHLGFVFASLGKKAEALRSFRQALELNPNDAMVKQGMQELR